MNLVPIQYRREYTSWRNLKQRCVNPRNKDYHNYGARGIKVCDRWLHLFKNFLFDMRYKPGPEYSLDRKDNVSFATRSLASINARSMCM
jgi:hypothetical protein